MAAHPRPRYLLSAEDRPGILCSNPLQRRRRPRHSKDQDSQAVHRPAPRAAERLQGRPSVYHGGAAAAGPLKCNAKWTWCIRSVCVDVVLGFCRPFAVPGSVCTGRPLP